MGTVILMGTIRLGDSIMNSPFPFSQDAKRIATPATDEVKREKEETFIGSMVEVEMVDRIYRP